MVALGYRGCKRKRGRSCSYGAAALQQLPPLLLLQLLLQLPFPILVQPLPHLVILL